VKSPVSNNTAFVVKPNAVKAHSPKTPKAKHKVGKETWGYIMVNSCS